MGVGTRAFCAFTAPPLPDPGRGTSKRDNRELLKALVAAESGG